jgi:hypothetical protein
MYTLTYSISPANRSPIKKEKPPLGIVCTGQHDSSYPIPFTLYSSRLLLQFSTISSLITKVYLS